jgi:exodeoxyribonuclease-3
MSRIKMLSWNVNGLRAAYKTGFMDIFRAHGPDILCLQETKAQEEQLPSALRHVDGYKAYFSSAEKKGYSGVGLYTKQEPLEVRYELGKAKFDTEGRVIASDFGDFILFNVYFPNGKASKERLDFKMEFYDAFLDHLDALKAQGKKIIICGDVNTAHKEIDLARPKENEKVSGFLPLERAWIGKLIDHGYLDTLRMFSDQPDQYTWWDMKTKARERNVGWRIDYFFASDNLKDNIISAFILPDIMGSDHCPIGLELEI